MHALLSEPTYAPSDPPKASRIRPSFDGSTLRLDIPGRAVDFVSATMLGLGLFFFVLWPLTGAGLLELFCIFCLVLVFGAGRRLKELLTDTTLSIDSGRVHLVKTILGLRSVWDRPIDEFYGIEEGLRFQLFAGMRMYYLKAVFADGAKAEFGSHLSAAEQSWLRQNVNAAVCSLSKRVIGRVAVEELVRRAEVEAPPTAPGASEQHAAPRALVELDGTTMRVRIDGDRISRHFKAKYVLALVAAGVVLLLLPSGPVVVVLRLLLCGVLISAVWTYAIEGPSFDLTIGPKVFTIVRSFLGLRRSQHGLTADIYCFDAALDRDDPRNWRHRMVLREGTRNRYFSNTFDGPEASDLARRLNDHLQALRLGERA